jgi:hypothetical protein
MPVTVKFSRKFYETLGDEVAKNAVDVLHQPARGCAARHERVVPIRCVGHGKKYYPRPGSDARDFG